MAASSMIGAVSDCEMADRLASVSSLSRNCVVLPIVGAAGLVAAESAAGRDEGERTGCAGVALFG
jgi:hypothetical protein